MPRIMKQFVVDIFYNDKPYTVQQVLDYINQFPNGLEDNEKIKRAVEQSSAKLQAVMKTYGLTVHQILQKKTSPAGTAIANVALEHANEVIKAI